MVEENFLVEGVIVPTGWDEKGDAKSISLSTNSEQVLPILMDDMGLSLLGSLQKLIRAKVALAQTENGKKIRVLSFKKIVEYSL